MKHLRIVCRMPEQPKAPFHIAPGLPDTQVFLVDEDGTTEEISHMISEAHWSVSGSEAAAAVLKCHDVEIDAVALPAHDGNA